MASTELADPDVVEDAVDAVATADPADAPTSPPAQRRGGWATLLICLLCVAAVVWLVVELVQRPGAKPPGDAQAAVSAAEKQALSIMTLDYKSAKPDLERVINASTGTMKSQYAQSESGTVSATTSAKSVSTGTVSAAGLSYPKGKSSFTGNKAEVLVVGDATVAFPKTSTAAASKVQVHYRFVFEMQNVNGVWKSAQLNFAGLPSYSQVGS
jgi:Mce-associated membrane protein